MARIRRRTAAIATRLATTRDHVYAWLASLIAVVGIVVLAAIQVPIPDALYVIAGGTVGAGAGLSKPSE